MNAFAAIVFASLLSRLGYQMARSPVLPAFAADLGALPEFIGVIVAASTVTGVFFKLPSGALSDVLGRKRMMVLGALFFALPPFLYPIVGNPWSLLTLRFVHGFATAIFSPVAAAYVASLAETGRGARLGWFSSGNDIGATAGPLIGGFVLFFSASYAVTYLLVGAIGVLTLLVVVWLPDVDRPSDRQVTTFAARAAESRPVTVAPRTERAARKPDPSASLSTPAASLSTPATSRCAPAPAASNPMLAALDDALRALDDVIRVMTDAGAIEDPHLPPLPRTPTQHFVYAPLGGPRRARRTRRCEESGALRWNGPADGPPRP